MAQESDMPASKSKTQHSRRSEPEINSTDHGTLFHWTDYGFSPLRSQVIEIKVPETQSVWGISLGLRLTDTRSVIDRLKAGLSIRSFEHLSRAMEIPPVRLAAVTSIARRTLARRKTEGRLQLAESERVFRLATLFDKAVEVLGDTDRARQWFKTPLKALGGKSPLEYSDTEIGAREVEDLLGRLEHGVFS